MVKREWIFAVISSGVLPAYWRGGHEREEELSWKEEKEISFGVVK
jgi:hypothetical protein